MASDNEAEKRRRGIPGREAARQAVEVAAGLVFRGGKLLIARRAADAHLGGLWEFPGGKREPEETFEQCLVRELREEVGIEVKVDEHVETIIHDYPEKVVHLEFFRCEWLRHEPEPLGCDDIRWISVHELKQFVFPAADERLLERLSTEPALWRGKP